MRLWSGGRYGVRRVAAGMLAAASLEACASAAEANVPVLVADINRAPVRGGAISRMYAVGAQIFFLGRDATHGEELWRSDGTAEGTRLVRDLWAGTGSSAVVLLGQTNGVLIFSAKAAEGTGLWRSDGTAEGTWKLADVVASEARSRGGLVWFTAKAGGTTEGPFLPWRTDGTMAGTFPLVPEPGTAAGESRVGSSSVSTETLPPVWTGPVNLPPYRFTEMGGEVFLGTLGGQLWRTGGTPESSVPVLEIPVAEGDEVRLLSLLGVGSWISMLTWDDQGLAWWGSDGVAEEPVVLHVWPTWRAMQEIGRIGGAALLRVKTTAGEEMWRSDGTAAGTRLVKAFAEGTPGGFTAAADRIYFTLDTEKTGSEPWVTDGTAAGTHLLKDIRKRDNSSGSANFRAVGGAVFFTAWDNKGPGLWQTNGEAKGTKLVKGLLPKGWVVRREYLSSLGEDLYFTAEHELEGVALWRRTGMEKKAEQVARVGSGTGSGAGKSGVIGYPDERSGYARLMAVPAWGEEVVVFRGEKAAGESLLWRSDGTAAGTYALEKASKFTRQSGTFSSLVAAGESVLFRRYRSWFESSDRAGAAKKWRVPKRTERPNSLSGEVRAGSWRFFSDDRKVWALGDTKGELIGLGDRVNSQGTLQFVPAGDGVLYFTSTDALWRADAAAGTLRMVREWKVTSLATLGDTAYFTTVVASTYTQPGSVKLWRCEGTVVSEVGTMPGGSGGKLVVAGGALWTTGYSGSTGGGLWQHNETSGEWEAWEAWPWTNEPVLIPGSPEGRVYFKVALAETGEELWVSDGTQAGTRMVRDICPGPRSSSIRESLVVGDHLYFSADDGVHGVELWVSDGTAEGTRMVADLTGDSGGSLPYDLTLAGNRLYFTAQTEAYGRELYYLDVQAFGFAASGDDSIPGAADGKADLEILRAAFRLNQGVAGLPVMIPATGTAGLPHFTMTGESGGKVFRVEYLRSKSGRWTYEPMISESLEPGSFQPMAGTESVSPVDDDWERVTVEQAVDLRVTPRLFGVVKVTEN